jgi:eukaryotic-like serine/threonine-protein kinase
MTPPPQQDSGQDRSTPDDRALGDSGTGDDHVGVGGEPAILERYLDLLRSGDRRAAEHHIESHAGQRESLVAVRTAWERLSPLLDRLDRVGLAERLRTRFGDAVDPGISLSGDPRGKRPSGGPTGEYRARFGRDGLAERRYAKPHEIARGGMGSIRRVWDNDLRRELVMKAMLLPRDRSEGVDTRPPDSRLLSRFLEEAQVTSQLDHPGILPVHDIGVDADGRLFFTMPLVKGEELGRVIALARGERPQPQRNTKIATDSDQQWDRTRVLGAILKAMEAVAFAHSRNVVHRDIKPENIMVGRFGETYVMDWGLARVLEESQKAERRPANTFAALDELRSRTASAPAAAEPSIQTDRTLEVDPEGANATLDGDIIGTPGYMAPEQARGERERVGPLADVYSFGTILYQLLTGYRPYDDPLSRKSGLGLLERVLETEPTPIRKLQKDLPDELVAICEQAMQADPADRYPSLLDMLEDLRAYLEGRVVKAYDTSLRAEVTKWIRRNLLAATILFVSLVLGATGTGLFIWQLKGSLAAREAALDEARSASEKEARSTVEAREAERVARDAEAVAQAALAEAERTAAELLVESAAALEGRRQALLQSYAANLSAVQASIADNDLSEARRRLAMCPEELRGWEYDHLFQRVDMSLRMFEDPAVHRDGVRDVDVSNDGQMASVGRDGLHTWDADSGDALEHWSIRDATFCAFAPDGSSIVVLDASGRVVRVRPGRSDFEVVLAGDGQFEPDSVAALSPDGRTLAIGRAGPDGPVVEFVDLRRGTLSTVALGANLESTTALAWHPNGVDLGLGVRGATNTFAFQVLDSSTGRTATTAEAIMNGQVTGVCFDPQGRFVSVCTAAGELLVQETAPNTIRLYQASSERVLVSTAFAADSDLVYVGTSNGAVEVWELETGERRLELRGHDGPSSTLDYDALRGQMVSGSRDGTLRSWPLASGDVVQALDVSLDRRSQSLMFVGDGQQLVVGARDGGETWDSASLRLATRFEVGDGREIDDLHALPAGNHVVGVVRTNEGSSLARGSEPWTTRWSIEVWSTATGGAPLRRLTGSPGDPRASALSSLGDLAVAFDPSGAGETRVFVYALGSSPGSSTSASLGPPRALEGFDRPVVGLAYEPNGRRLACGHVDGSISIWSARDMVLLKVLTPPDVAFARVRQELARSFARSTAARIGGVVADASRTTATDEGRRAATHMTFEPGGRLLASGGPDGIVRLWDTETGRLVRELEGHDGAITALAGHPSTARTELGTADGRFVSGSDDGSLRVWSSQLDQSLLVLRGHAGTVVDACFDPAGRRLASLDANGELRLFETEPQLERYASRRDADRDTESAIPLLVDLLDGLARQGTSLTDLLSGASPMQMAGRSAAKFLGSRPAPLHDQAWSIVQESDRSAREYEQALAYARVAVLLLPENPIYQRTFGIALYRNGSIDEAIEVIESSSRQHGGGPRPEELALLGLCAVARAELRDASQYLDQVEALVRLPLWSNDSVCRRFRDELRRELER